MKIRWFAACVMSVVFEACVSAQSLPVLKYLVFPAPPYMIGAEGADSEPRGIDVHIMREFARRAGYEIQFIRAPWVRCLEIMKDGKADFLSSAYKRPEREKYMKYLSSPYLTSLPVSFYSLIDSAVKIAKFEDIERYEPIGVLRGAGYFKRFDEDASIFKYDVATQDSLYPMLLAGRFRVMAGYVPTEAWYIRENGLHDKVVRSEYVFAEPVEVYFALSLRSPNIAKFAQWDSIFSQMKKDGVYRDAMQAYIGD